MKVDENKGQRGATLAGEHAAVLTQYFSQREDEMVHLTASDIWLEADSKPADNVECTSMSALIIWQDGRCSFARMGWNASGRKFQDQLNNCWGTMFGPIHVKIGYVPNYHDTGKGMWTFEFSPNDILAWRCALMTEEEFARASAAIQ